MLATVTTIVATHEGAIIDLLLSGVFFAGKVSRLSRAISTLADDGRTLIYRLEGQVFFASVETNGA